MIISQENINNFFFIHSWDVDIAFFDHLVELELQGQWRVDPLGDLEYIDIGPLPRKAFNELDFQFVTTWGFWFWCPIV